MKIVYFPKCLNAIVSQNSVFFTVSAAACRSCCPTFHSVGPCCVSTSGGRGKDTRLTSIWPLMKLPVEFLASLSLRPSPALSYISRTSVDASLPVTVSALSLDMYFPLLVNRCT